MAIEPSIRGVPRALAMDAWWLDTAPPGGGGGAQGGRVQPVSPSFLGAVLALVVLADLLFWRQALGISVVIFAAALFAFQVARTRAPAWRRPALLLGLAALPALDHVQALSLAFLLAGLAASLTWLHRPAAPSALLLQIALGFLRHLPRSWIRMLNPRAALIGLTLQTPNSRVQTLRVFARSWALPIGGSLVFAALLMQANPVIAQLLDLRLDLFRLLQRLLFWFGTAIVVSPFLMPMAEPEPRGPRTFRFPAALLRATFNAGSVLRALVVFNLLIAVQSLTDLSIITGGAELPTGMTLAEYAHRGAYPLLATAILAGVFALAARPFLGEHHLIKPLLLTWLAQNTVLCAAAALRLDLYIAAFGLTYLRLYALIWMGLVAVGLIMALVQVLRDRSNAWLLVRGVILGVATLYLCSFVNIAQVIAAQNVTRSAPDQYYLCSLGPLAAGPLVESGIGQRHGDRIWLEGCALDVPEVQNWREWGFRTWVACRYVLRTENAKGEQ